MTISLRTIARASAWLLGWAWALLAGVGGFMLLVHEGPLPITNGWFAMFSGIAACPLTGRVLARRFGVPISGWQQFALAVVIMLAGRIAVMVVLHRPILPGPWAAALCVVLLAIFGSHLWAQWRAHRPRARATP